MFLRLVLVAAFTFGVWACDKPGHAQCEEACWHQRSMHFWEAAEFEISRAPEAEREALRKDKQADWEALRADPNSGSADVCIEQCKEQGKKSQVKCIIESSTFAEAEKCTK